MIRRQFPRIKRRVNCDVSVGEHLHVGVVLDLSPRGFFVQTSASPPIGSTVAIRLRHTGHPEVRVEARVANKRVVPRRMTSIARGGIGLTIVTPPEEYYALLGNLGYPMSPTA